MINLVLVTLIFLTFFGLDYWWYKKDKQHYQYVSRRTYLLFIVGQISLVAVFYASFEPFLQTVLTEIVLISTLNIFFLLFSYILSREKLLVCHYSSRTERCLTPYYVQVKGTEIVLQQLAYAVIAYEIVQILNTGWVAYLTYVALLLVIHTPLVLSTNPPAFQRLTFGILAISAPIYYIYTELNVFWPAIYLHVLLYVFLWLMDGNWEGSGKLVSHETKKYNHCG
jgi:hypothetical protein